MSTQERDASRIVLVAVISVWAISVVAGFIAGVTWVTIRLGGCAL